MIICDTYKYSLLDECRSRDENMHANRQFAHTFYLWYGSHCLKTLLLLLSMFGYPGATPALLVHESSKCGAGANKYCYYRNLLHKAAELLFVVG